MSLVIPSLGELVERTRRAFAAALPGLDAWLWPNNIGPTAKVIGEGLAQLYGRMAIVERRRFIWSADWDGLIEHGRDYALPPKSAAVANGTVTLVAPGAVTVAAGAILTRSDGQTYVVPTAAALTAAGSLSLPVTAVTAGAAGNCLSGQALSATSGVTGTATFTVAVDAIVDGVDAEGRESYRARLLFRKQNPPGAGTPADFVRWAMSVPGVVAAYVERCWPAPGGLRVFVLADGSTGSAVPSPALVGVATQVIALQAPAGSVPMLVAPTALPIDVTISGLLPATRPVQEAVLAELRDLFGVRRARPSGGDTAVAGMPFLATPVTFSRSWISQAISAASGEDRHTLIAPAVDPIVPAGSIATLGNVTFL
ncbi:hypothetical protein EYW49_20530 [Siculibacillus lacustris]|uniref:Uncharacterized protein n=1 Tax=Siculibacillus lacustris TaxID=1549641 RepID=A0A4Q9VEU8_9HYPH|nr:baseplate J/gp47 family protein [Siculibacillus lacustris]TBW33348.1 hypothetical protein EYW49_20530 [Siculibacillus lacustris]